MSERVSYGIRAAFKKAVEDETTTNAFMDDCLQLARLADPDLDSLSPTFRLQLVVSLAVQRLMEWAYRQPGHQEANTSQALLGGFTALGIATAEMGFDEMEVVKRGGVAFLTAHQDRESPNVPMARRKPDA
jgi:hypothetical protein